MSKYLVIVVADVEADDPEAAHNDAMTHIEQYRARVWTVPENLDEDPQLTEIGPTRRRWAMPPEPGPEFTAVRNDEGAVWDRQPSPDLWSDHHYWQRRTEDPYAPHGMVTWGALIIFEERVTDATEED